jgi:hypothetical protein
MLARHRQEHPRDFWILANVFVEGLPNEVAERNVVLRLASNFASVTTEAPTSIDKPTISLAIVGRLYAVLPTFLGLKLFRDSVVRRRFRSLCNSDRRNTDDRSLDKFTSILVHL